jgi:phenylpyruvate tautomerase PptA (4-oxalocrotonate tautomerase family)
MPLVSINLRKGRPPEVKRAIADAVHATVVANLGIPETDRFQQIREYESADFIHSDAHLDLTYTPDLIMLEISFVEGRSDEVKKALLKGHRHLDRLWSRQGPRRPVTRRPMPERPRR